MEYDPTRMCEMLVGLGDVEVLGIDDKEARRCGCASAGGCRDRRVGGAAGRCGPTGSDRWRFPTPENGHLLRSSSHAHSRIARWQR